MHINIPNSFISDDENKLTGDELYLYYFLCLNELRWFPRKIIISIDTISNKLKLMKNDNQNKERIEMLIKSLRNKGAISFDDIKTTSKGKFKSHQPIDISLHGENEYKNGYEKINYSLFKRMNEFPESKRGNYFLVCCYILKVKREIPYIEWASILECSEKQARNIIGEAVESGLIEKRSGRYYVNDNNQIRQEVNGYKVIDNIPDAPEQEQDMETIEINWGNWKGTNNLNESDFDLYWEQYHIDQFKAVADAKLARITKSDKAKYKVNLLLDQAKRRHEKNKLDKEMLEYEERLEDVLSANQGKAILKDNEGNLLVLDNNLFEKIEFDEFKDKFSNGSFIFDEDCRKNVMELFSRCHEQTALMLFDTLKQIVNQKGTLTIIDFIDLCDYKKQIVTKNNKNKKYDEEWEGDFIDPYTGINYSLVQRKKDMSEKDDEEDIVSILS